MSLVLSDVTLSYPDGDGRLTALDRIDLTVEAGEFVAVTGPSGSGKSSLLAVAGTLVAPDSGTVLVGGVRTADLSAAERARVRRDHIGFVFQQDNLLPPLTALEQVLLAVDLRKGGRRAHRTRAMELLEQVGLADAADRRPHQLSGGMRQRVNIARSLMGSPSLLLVDEPTSALDRERGRQIIALLAGLVRERGVATVVVSHDLDALDPGNRTGVDATASIADGRILRVERHRSHVGARFVETAG
ncbi:ABC transporter ATP-binding protein [Kitasatospora sp. NPDC059327]|uniref:ABC transporter ATP-binding protein n=1 Tax=Kitasatospora sp. NPDC059327 TaxID=3346803 RepID=UPI0036B01CE5